MHRRLPPDVYVRGWSCPSGYTGRLQAPPLAVCGRLPAWHCCVPWGRAPPCTCWARSTGGAVVVAKHAATMLDCSKDFEPTTMGSVPGMSLYWGHTNPLDGLKTLNEVTKVLDGVHTPIQPDTRLQQGCNGGETGEQRRERGRTARARGVTRFRTQEDKTDRRAGSRDRSAGEKQLYFLRNTLGPIQVTHQQMTILHSFLDLGCEYLPAVQ